jgi:D-glycero-alpha-D-manno-heptose-7-phosphate kinase
MHIYSDFPLGSGLGGSATVSVAILACFNELRRDKWTQYEVAELAYQAERHILGVSGGWQDQYASVFGGFNFMEFKNHQNLIHPLRLPRKTQLLLEESLILCDTGILHNSDLIHKEQSNALKDEERNLFIKQNVDMTYLLRDSLLKGHLDSFGEFLNTAWKLKKEFNSKISNVRIDEIYDFAIKNGAIGGKLLGAGGGGFFLFYVQPIKKIKLVDLLELHDLKVRRFNFELNGLESWTIREFLSEEG